MQARGLTRIPCALLVLAVMLMATSVADAWEQQYRYPVKIRVSGTDQPDVTSGGVGRASRFGPSDWEVAAGQARREVLCPKRGYAFALGMRPFFSTIAGSSKVVSRGGEGTYLNLVGHLRLPPERTLWEFYSYLRVWDRIGLRLEYAPWIWDGPGHVPGDGNFAGLLLKRDDAIQSDLNITTLLIGGDYDVSFGRELTFGPNADLHIIRWTQRVVKGSGESADFSQTILQPAIGAHLRYDPQNTGYFSWFKPYLEGRFSWMNFGGLGLSTWDLAAGVAPPVSRNVDAGFKIGYKQWKIDGNRGRLFADVGVEGPYLDFALQF
ncbi:MAG: hypothetical protein HY913_17725 [Desulfomonile tiedjei]|nr:hypothetical protein [Desulfomonile tiedjei]